MSAAILRTLLLTAIGVVFWYSARKWHKRSTSRASGYYVIRVPVWLSWLCGRPLPDNQVELALMVFQLLALLFTILWLPLIVLLRIGDLLVNILTAAFVSIPAFVALTVRYAATIVDRHRAKKSQ